MHSVYRVLVDIIKVRIQIHFALLVLLVIGQVYRGLHQVRVVIFARQDIRAYPALHVSLANTRRLLGLVVVCLVRLNRGCQQALVFVMPDTLDKQAVLALRVLQERTSRCQGVILVLRVQAIPGV